jgi:dihydropteroate synthase
MQVHKLSSSIDIKKYLKNLGVDGGGVSILSSKSEIHLIEIKNLKVGGANILKQDALSIGADLAVPKGTVTAKEPFVNCLLIATTSQLIKLAKKELAQPFGLKDIALYLQEILEIKKIKNVELMGVINANNDSFFADSRFQNEDAIVSIKKMINDGASIIDIGGVSSAPNSSFVDVEIELQRIKPICDLIKKEKLYEKVDFSIDSYEPKVIEYALKSGFKIVNDITGLENDEVCKIIAKYNAKVVIMHMQGTPKTMQDNPTYKNILDEVYEFFEKRIQKAKSYNIQDLVLDVGIGFGKTLEHNLMLIKNLETFKTLNYPLLVGASRKSMIDKISSSKVSQRLSGTLTLHNEAVKNGASILRVHDVFEHAQALRVLKALENI